MFAWPHSGFGAHIGPAIAGVNREALLRVARYSARAPVAESRLRYDAGRAEVELVPDRSDGPYAGIHRFSALEFIARWVDHVPDRYETRVRYYGAYATRRRVWWQRRGISLVKRPAAESVPSEPAADWPALRARRRRWTELLQLVFKVEIEVCPRCGGSMKGLGFITEQAVVRRILAHLDRRQVDARDPAGQASPTRSGARLGDSRTAETPRWKRPGGGIRAHPRRWSAVPGMRVPIHRGAWGQWRSSDPRGGPITGPCVSGFLPQPLPSCWLPPSRRPRR